MANAIIHVRGKGGKDRSVPIEAPLVEVLDHYLDSCAVRFPATAGKRSSPAGGAWPPAAPLFVAARSRTTVDHRSMGVTRGAATMACAAVLATAACGPSDSATNSTAKPPALTSTSVNPTPTLSDAAIAREARSFLLGQYGLGPDQQFPDIPPEGAGSGDWARQIDRITYVRESHELDVFMSITTENKDTALDAAHSIGLMVRQDPALQQNVGYVRVGDKTGDELALQIQCPLSLSDNACQPAIWLR
jgi:hypothetical protein